MTPDERAEDNISLNREWNTDAAIRKQIAAEIADAVATAKCPECYVKNLAQYQDKYGIVEHEWTKEQCLEAMKMIHYDRMDLERKTRQAVEEALTHSVSEQIPKYFRKGQAEAYADAAKIAHDLAVRINYIASCREDVADYLNYREKIEIETCKAIAKEIHARAAEVASEQGH